MTQDLDHSLELIGAVLLFLLPFLMAWLEDGLQERTSVDRQSIWRSLRPYLPTRWPRR